MNYEKLHKDTITKLQEMVNSEKITAEIAREICADFVPESEDEKIKEQVIYAINQLHICECTKNKLLAWLEKQGEDKKINNFIVFPGLYKCVHRMFDGTPNGKLLFEKGEIYKCLSKHDRAEFEVSYGHSVYLEDPVVYKHFIPFEKQDEQNLANEVKPKFKIGYWIVYHRNDSSTEIMRVYDIRDNRYYFNDNIHFSWSVKECDEKCHLWTIQDAKDGDVLCSHQLIILFKQWEPNTNCNFVIAHAGIDISGKLQITNGHWLISNESKPATKEQRALLFQKIKEAGYEWDVEKKELKKIEQNPAWSEEDEYYLNSCITKIEIDIQNWEGHGKTMIDGDKEIIFWLKSLKERIQLQPQPK